MPCLVDVMSNPRLYGSDVQRVDVIETHISWVFLAGDRAYKVKKPVRTPFLDYTSLASRRHYCSEELRLNRRLAPSLYLGVKAIVPAGAGFALADEDSAAAVDYAVEMNRMPAGQTLDARVKAGGIESGDIARVAQLLAAFHATAVPAPEAAAFDAQLEPALDSLLESRSTPLVRRLRTAILRLRDDRETELAERVERGLVRDCHGDLRAEHVVLGHAIEVFDCIEFDQRLREIDVGADLAFLVMDLERLGGRQAAERLVAEYQARGGDPGSPQLQALFCAYRAVVRALVAALRANQLSGCERTAALCEADTLVRLAWRFVWRRHLPLVLVVCGPAAVGKTTLAAEIADLTGLPHLNSDHVRKALAGISPTTRGDESLYTRAMNRRVYQALARQAGTAPDGAIVDATFRLRADREAFMADLEPVDPVFVQCTAPPAVIEARAARRLEDSRRESDADVARAIGQYAEFEQLTEVPRSAWLCVSTAGPISLVAAAVEAGVAGARAAADVSIRR